jgi:hypothetical protein
MNILVDQSFVIFSIPTRNEMRLPNNKATSNAWIAVLVTANTIKVTGDVYISTNTINTFTPNPMTEVMIYNNHDISICTPFRINLHSYHLYPESYFIPEPNS